MNRIFGIISTAIFVLLLSSCKEKMKCTPPPCPIKVPAPQEGEICHGILRRVMKVREL